LSNNLNLSVGSLYYISEGATRGRLLPRRLEGVQIVTIHRNLLRIVTDDMNHADLENFMINNGKDILSFCKYLTKNKEEAEDLYQDTFVRGFETSERIKDDDHAKKYLLSIAVMLWKNRKLKYACRQRIVNDKIIPLAEYEMDAAAREDTPEQEYIRQEMNSVVRECVDLLPDKRRLVILLHYSEGLSEKEISEVLGIPKGTVKSRIHKAKSELKKLLAKRL